MIAWRDRGYAWSFLHGVARTPTSRDKTMFQSALRLQWIYVSFESRGSRQALSEVEGRVALRGTVVFKPTSLRKALHLPNWHQQKLWR